MGLFNFFYRVDKQALRWAMHHSRSRSESIYLDTVFCQIDQSGDKFSVGFSCRCTDPNLTGYSMDSSYRLFKRDGFLVIEAARGFLTEQVYAASQSFQETAFFSLFNSKNGYMRLMYPSANWEVPPPRVYICKICRSSQTIPEVDCRHIPEGFSLPCNRGCGATHRVL